MVIKDVQFKLYKRAIGSLILLYIFIFTLFFIPFYQESKEKVDKELELIVDYKKNEVQSYFNQLKVVATRVVDKSDMSKIIVKYHLNQIDLNDLKNYVNEKLIDILNISDELLGVSS